MAMQMESSICAHSEYVTAKGTGGFTVRFLFFDFLEKLFKKVLTNRELGVIMITEIKGSDLPLEVKYGSQNHSICFRSICADYNFRHR